MLKAAFFKPEEKDSKLPKDFNEKALTLYQAINSSNIYKPSEENKSIFLALINLNGSAHFYCESLFEQEKIKAEYKPEQGLSVR